MNDLISRQAAKNVLANLGIDIEDYWEDAIDELPSVEPEKCGDCISRQAVLDIQTKYAEHMGATKYWQMRDNIRALPPVTPQPEKRTEERTETRACDCISRQAVLEKAINIPIAKIVTDDKVICRKVVFVDDIEKLPSVETEQQGRECASCKHSNNGECAYTEECHKCMWESQYERQVEPERKSGKWVHMVGWWECNQCHAEYTDMPTCMGKAIYEYCPMCGAKMEEV